MPEDRLHPDSHRPHQAKVFMQAEGADDADADQVEGGGGVEDPEDGDGEENSRREQSFHGLPSQGAWIPP